METGFLSFIRKQDLFSPGDRILLAVSGGIDSVVMTHLFASAGYHFGIAHCNFSLRGEESDQDELFVKQLAVQHRVTIYTRRFNTEEYAGKKKISIQMAARELRYAWFEEIRQKNGYDLFATAHHRDDVVETILINLIRGTGFRGLQGIRPRSGKLIRPLLFASRQEIEVYARNRKLRFRVDSSNGETKYLRNRIRLELIPIIHSLNPSFDEALMGLASQVERISEYWDMEVGRAKTLVTKGSGERISISIPRIMQHPDPHDLLWEIIRPYGFNPDIAGDIHASLTAAPGKRFFSATHQLLKDRDSLIIVPLHNTVELRTIPLDKPVIITPSSKTKRISHRKGDFSPGAPSIFLTGSEIANCPVTLTFQVQTRASSFVIPTDPDIACFNYDKLQFPLTIRKWMKGDHFFPLGMRKPKKLSDFFVDQKIPRIDKEHTWLLLSGNDIIWIIGRRIDHRYRITGQTKKVLMVTARV
ncbi:MAG: tRNA lysidine(34) synthetase TilS [Alphaproteobacteria bacterium]|nr:tRNA lysidine(34) synthetase TilS [Alphaproteobacteria bacterium]